MSGVGFWELIFLFLIGLLVLGPERLPRVANQLGSWLGQARRMTRVLKRQLEDELDLEKEMNIRPRAATGQLPRSESTGDAEQKDDTWSPAHDAHGPGTGVGDSATSPGLSDNPGSGNDEFTDTDVLDDPKTNAADEPVQNSTPTPDSGTNGKT